MAPFYKRLKHLAPNYSKHTGLETNQNQSLLQRLWIITLYTCNYITRKAPKTLEWVSIPFSRGSLQPRDRICVSCTGRWLLYHWATREACSTEIRRNKQQNSNCGKLFSDAWEKLDFFQSASEETLKIKMISVMVTSQSIKRVVFCAFAFPCSFSSSLYWKLTICSKKLLS